MTSRGPTRSKESGRFVRNINAVDPLGHYTCNVCMVCKPLSGFHRDLQKKTGYAYTCKECDKLGRRRRAGVKLNADQLMTLQEIKCCEVCGGEGRLHIDHDHITGSVRGVLCQGCNIALGQIRDDPARLRFLADYLEERSG